MLNRSDLHGRAAQGLGYSGGALFLDAFDSWLRGFLDSWISGLLDFLDSWVLWLPGFMHFWILAFLGSEISHDSFCFVWDFFGNSFPVLYFIGNSYL